MKKPKDIDKYTSRDDAVVFLLGLTYRVLSLPVNDRVKVSISYSRWNDDWADKSKKQPAVVAERIDTHTKETRQ